MDEKGEKGLEEERRLAYVGLTRAREEARVSFAANRQVYGRWTSQLPSRFVDELPMANVEAASETGYYGGGPGMNEASAAAGTTRRRSARRLRLRRAGSAPSSAAIRRPARAQPVIEGEGRLVAVSEPSAGPTTPASGCSTRSSATAMVLGGGGQQAHRGVRPGRREEGDRHAS